MADLNTEAFRHAPHPPFDTLALLGSTCYQTLLSKLISIWGVTDIMPTFPAISQVHQELRKTAILLLHQQDNPDFPSFANDLRKFCTITFQTPSLSLLRCCLHGSTPTILDVSLGVVAMQKQLQQEEQTIFFPGGAQCLLQERMLQAQMEVSLFSNAIANACEDLEDRSHPDEHTVGPKKPVTVKAVEDVGACLAPSLVRLGSFCPLNNIIEKCNAWLLALPCFQGATKVIATQTLDFPQTLKPEYLPIPPCLNKMHSFKAKESKSLDVLRSKIHIMDLKKHCTQTEVNMLSEAISCIAESKGSDSSDVCSTFLHIPLTLYWYPKLIPCTSIMLLPLNTLHNVNSSDDYKLGAKATEHASLIESSEDNREELAPLEEVEEFAARGHGEDVGWLVRG
ncbi:hypothetical protein DFJ58DRAFT_847891 [Suillus subalutaceus]|uniref:uncharacterized protein n=1 Tax=Suillus subalutaceus TaxID=48586 RepID=UPI001B869B80|nr:uncharacterized protein DFJ58DRAFT_847891 [Suillus subalutaceus]KAG1833194.1 hypothetical protein DFJ58DRAFT_847891 [Suillus subalutaceus]